MRWAACILMVAAAGCVDSPPPTALSSATSPVASAGSKELAADDVEAITAAVTQVASEHVTGAKRVSIEAPQSDGTRWMAEGFVAIEGQIVPRKLLAVGAREQSRWKVAALLVDGSPVYGDRHLVNRQIERLDAAVSRKSLPKAAGDEPRRWQSSDGQFSTKATFAGTIGDDVRLRKADGSVVTVSVEKLAAEDQQWIDERLKQSR